MEVWISRSHCTNLRLRDFAVVPLMPTRVVEFVSTDKNGLPFYKTMFCAMVFGE